MFNKPLYKLSELLLLFIALPIVLALDIPVAYSVVLVLFGIIYCIWVSRKLNLISTSSLYQFELKNHLLRISLTFLMVVLLSGLFMYTLHPDDLFVVVKKSPSLWLGVSFFYALFSVYPQELLYRSYFFKRYEGVFKTKYLLMINMLVFPIAHLFFDNGLVLLVTLLGGIFFTLTYHRSKSVLLTSIEHALYGNWLFTIGMGEMLAFPMPQ